MEVLGYLHTAVDFEDAVGVEHAIDSDRTDTDRFECDAHASGRSPDSALPSLNGLTSSALGISALLCSLSIVMGTTSGAIAMMQNGDAGVEVTVLQQELASLGFFNNDVTGYFGDITQAAVEQFQNANGLVPDGIVGQGTEAVLESYTSPSVVAIANTPTVVSTVQTNLLQNQMIQRQLALGLSGPDVTQLQLQLTQAGIYQGPITGYYGTLTQAAVTRFQQLNGLIASGIVDSNTLAVLNQTLIALDSMVVESVEVVPVVSRQAAPQVVVQTVPQPVITRPSTERVVVVPASNQMMYRGDSGQPVRQIQQILTELEFYDGPITGYYGSLTEEAVVRFQQTIGLEANGVTGPITWQALLNRSEVI